MCVSILLLFYTSIVSAFLCEINVIIIIIIIIIIGISSSQCMTEIGRMAGSVLLTNWVNMDRFDFFHRQTHLTYHHYRSQ